MSNEEDCRRFELQSFAARDRHWYASFEIANKGVRGYSLILDAERLGSHDRWAGKLLLDATGQEVRDLGYCEDFPMVYMASPFPTLEDAIEHVIEMAHRFGHKVTIAHKSTIKSPLLGEPR